MKLSRLFEGILRENNEFYHGSPYHFEKFDMTKVGSGDGLSKFGFGLYFADNKNTAVYYAKELSKGENRLNGFNLYTVKLIGIDRFLPWEEEIPLNIHECVISGLIDLGKDNDAETMQQEYEDYGTTWSLRSTYEILEHMLGGKRTVTEFLHDCGVYGAIAQSSAHEDNVYTAFSDDIIKIIDIEKLNSI